MEEETGLKEAEAVEACVEEAGDVSGEVKTAEGVLEATEEGVEAGSFEEGERKYYRGLLEAMVFVSPEPVSTVALAKQTGLHRRGVEELLLELLDEYDGREGGLRLFEIAGGYQFGTAPGYGEILKKALMEKKKERLSRSMMETLAIICYRQPITLPELEEVRGVNSRGMVASLLSRRLIKTQGYRPIPGRPTLYVTTKNFLSHFALNSLGDLPSLEEVKALKFDEIL